MAEKDRIRKKQIILRVVDEEYKILKDKSELAGMNMSEFLRKAIYETSINVTKLSFEEISESSKAINLCSYEVNKIGNNINQLVKIIHENNDTYSQRQIESIMRDLENVRLEYEKLCEVMMNKLYGLE